jgi:hypothetical protein
VVEYFGCSPLRQEQNEKTRENRRSSALFVHRPPLSNSIKFGVRKMVNIIQIVSAKLDDESCSLELAERGLLPLSKSV